MRCPGLRTGNPPWPPPAPKPRFPLNWLAICARASFSLRNSASVGDSDIAAVTTIVRMVMPKMSGSRNDPAPAPPCMPVMPGAAGATCSAAIPV
jgi:hypothetical protein